MEVQVERTEVRKGEVMRGGAVVVVVSIVGLVWAG